MKRIALLNIISNIILQLVILATGFITSKLILSYFGSEVNGLISSITQFLNYITLIEGGMTGVISAQLYKPIINKDYEKISSIIVTSKKFYRKVAVIFIIYTLALSVLYPLFVSGSFSYWYILMLVLILSMNLFIQYMFSATYKILLNADKKIFIVSFAQICMYILGLLFGYLSLRLFPNIHVLKLITGVFFIIQPIVFSLYIKKHYDLNTDAKPDLNLLSKRWDGFAINVAAFIHFGTDIAILTIFTDLITVSIYSIYNLVTSGIRHIINSVSSALVPNIGLSYVSNDYIDINNKLDLYEFVMFILCFFFFGIAFLLITPFVMIYTKNITDADYYQPLFGSLLLISEFLYLIKFPHLNLAYSADKFKELKIPAFIEAFLNIIVSLILVNYFGLIGVAVGTIIAMLFRLVFQVHYTKQIIKDRNPYIFYKKFLIVGLHSAAALLICVFFIPAIEYTISSWVIHGIIYTLIFCVFYTFMCLLFFRNELLFVQNYLFHKSK